MNTLMHQLILNMMLHALSLSLSLSLCLIHTHTQNSYEYSHIMMHSIHVTFSQGDYMESYKHIKTKYTTRSIARTSHPVIKSTQNSLYTANKLIMINF